MSKKILDLHRDTNVVWIFDEAAKDCGIELKDATLIYDVTHVKSLTGNAYEIMNKNKIVSIQFGVSEVWERW